MHFKWENILWKLFSQILKRPLVFDYWCGCVRVCTCIRVVTPFHCEGFPELEYIMAEFKSMTLYCNLVPSASFRYERKAKNCSWDEGGYTVVVILLPGCFISTWKEIIATMLEFHIEWPKSRQRVDEMISLINVLKINGKKARNIFTLFHTKRESRLDFELKRCLSNLTYSAAMIQVSI